MGYNYSQIVFLVLVEHVVETMVPYEELKLQTKQMRIRTTAILTTTSTDMMINIPTYTN